MPMNFARTGLLLVVLTAIFVLTGAAIGGQAGMLIAFAVALVMNLVSLWNSDKLVLRMFGAKQVDERSAPELVGMVRELAARAELPMPRVYVMHSPQPNAFATGRSPERAAVAASTGLLEMLSREEIAGVIAHELAHIKNRDTLTMTVAATIGGAISMLAQYMQFGLLFGGNRDGRGGGLGWIGVLAVAIFAPMAAGLVQMAISRSREYQADKLGAMIVGNPLWLASALRKIQSVAKRVPNETAEAAPAMAHLFIINPLTGRGFDNWFSTHPDTENRIAELVRQAEEMGMSGGRGWLPHEDSEGAREAEPRSPWERPRQARPARGPWG